MIIDNPHCLQDLVRRHQPRPTHPDAEGIVRDLAPFPDDYARRYHAIAGLACREEYNRR